MKPISLPEAQAIVGGESELSDFSPTLPFAGEPPSYGFRGVTADTWQIYLSGFIDISAD